MPARPNNSARTRQRVQKPPPTLAVPDLQEDAAERKRVLNVLAQRRYRQRKREARRLESQPSPKGPAQVASPLEASPHSERGNVAAPESSFGEVENLAPASLGLPSGIDIQLQSPSSLLDFLDTGQPVQETLPWLAGVGNAPSLYPSNTESSPFLLSTLSSDPNLAQALPLVPDFFNINLAPDTPPSMSTATPPSTTMITSITPSPSPPSPLSTDSYYLPVPPLTLLRGLLRIATRLNAVPSVWSLSGVSPFITQLEGGLAPPSDLPSPWQPTPTQRLVPHHPVLDLLPWPGVRDRLIGFMSLDAELDKTVQGQVQGEGLGGQEAVAAVNRGGHDPGPSPTGSRLVDFIYDMEDNAEGLRIWGSDPYDEGCWEVGQVLFERWWFVFDRGVVEQSNRWRRQRGALPLRARHQEVSNPSNTG